MTATRKGEDESGGVKKREVAVLTLMAAIPATNSRRAREAGIEDPRGRSVTMGRKARSNLPLSKTSRVAAARRWDGPGLAIQDLKEFSRAKQNAPDSR